MLTWPPSLQNLYDLGGLPPEAYVRDARPIAAIHVSGNLIEIPGHGANGSPVRIVAKAGATLPTGVSATTWYTAGGTDRDFLSLVGVTLSDAGTGSLSLLEDVAPKILQRLATTASTTEAAAKAYEAPWSAAPDWAVQHVCTIVAFETATWLRLAISRYPLDDVREGYKAALAFRANVLEKGTPYQDAKGPIDGKPLVAAQGPVALKLKGREFGHGGEREDCA